MRFLNKIIAFAALFNLLGTSVLAQGSGNPPPPIPPPPPGLPIDEWIPVMIGLALLFGAYKMLKRGNRVSS